MKKIISTYLFILIAAFGVVSQTSNRPTAIDLTLRLITLRTKSLKADNDKQISAYNQEFRTEIKAAIEQNLEFEFDSIPSFGHVNSPDKKFEIYTWNILKEFDEYEYFAFIKFKKGEVLELSDQSRLLLSPEFKITKTDNWFGALYYQIVPVKNKKKERYYVLLGWDGNTGSSLKKVIDVLYFNERIGDWQMGKKIFGPPFRGITRFFLEYSSEVKASLKYHDKEERIVFDHLIPLNSGLEGVFEFYVPDLSFDGFEFRDDYWYFIQNIDVRGNQTMENYTTPKTNIRLE
mgnify:FL=1|tara:strand:+ start:33026 stop:33895 length:870 start_codon:yes stop_codon:yes gene_type:complete